MQISTDYNAFTQPTLIIVTSRQDAIVYLADNRDLEKILELHTKKPEYTDDEGHFGRSGNDRVFGQGSTEKEIDDIVYDEFKSDLAGAIDEIKEEFEQVILFAPEQYKNSTKDSLPKSIQDKIKSIHGVNILHEHPTDILKRLQ